MAYTEFSVNDVKYSTSTMDARMQLHVSRRLAPLMSLLQIVVRGRKPGDLATPISPEQLKEVITSATEIVGTMKDEDVDYILDACMSLVTRWDGGSWQRVWNSVTKRSQYDDITMITMMTICFNVMKVNLGSFTFASSFGRLA